ncbi:MAG TPA: DUF6140 family protein [Flavobacteriaceae bacterium]|nr:DUF6140 family protein [Flavobacteriaceae bacterium]
MATFLISTNQRLNVNGDFVDRGLSVQISTMCSNPFDDLEKIHNAFMRVHGLDLKSAGYLNGGYLTYKSI